MINEKELRIGNLYTTIRHQEIIIIGIDTLNKFVTINSSNNTEITAKNESSVIFEDLNPIEITTKTIADLGFSPDQSMSLGIVSDNDAKFMWNEKLNQVVLTDGNNGLI